MTQARPPIADYLVALERALGRPRGRRARRAISEIADHLNDAAAAQRETGMARADAERLAVEKFGTAEAVAASLRSANVLVGEMPGWLALPLWAGLSLSLASGIAFVWLTVWFNGVTLVFGVELVAAVVSLAAASLFARLHFGQTGLGQAGLRATAMAAGVLLFGGVGLGMLALWFALGSGDFEYYLFVRAAVVAGTGAVGLFAIWRAGRPVSA